VRKVPRLDFESKGDELRGPWLLSGEFEERGPKQVCFGVLPCAAVVAVKDLRVPQRAIQRPCFCTWDCPRWQAPPCSWGSSINILKWRAFTIFQRTTRRKRSPSLLAA